MPRSSLVVAGALANKPWNGGAAWTRLSWILGFARLGYDVHFVEQIDPSTCVNAAGARCPVDESINLAFFNAVTARFGLQASLIVEGEHRVIGSGLDELDEIARRADALINISGHLTVEPLKGLIRNRVFIDLDPGYTQSWHADGLDDVRLRAHHHYFTVGENIGRPCCPIPCDEITWRPIRQPVLLDEWPAVGCEDVPLRFTTVASWRGPFGRIRHGDGMYGVKAHEFRKVAQLPGRTGYSYEIALEADPADRRDAEDLRERGWSIVDAKAIVPCPELFRRYIQQSGAEFSVAQGIYVETESGWFSDRTVRYLACGRPVLVQDTGWSRNYPSGEGLLGFRLFEDAVAATHTIARDYDRHARRARALAEEFFDSRKVLSELLEVVQ